MYIIIAGCSKVGAILVKKFSEEGHDVVVIDRDPGNFAQLGSGCNCMTITGMPIDEDVLNDAGIKKADALAAVTPDDNTNIMIAQIAQQLYMVPKVLVETDDPERQSVLTVMGLKTICPTTLTVERFFTELLKGAAEE
ncbi:MAG: TrkA family potassium uptake protein [Clostridiaceae bacterium]|nr:TrkA family potassium uptake protein [Clostridiaceae bacterium]